MLVDTSPDLREQLLDAEVERVDAVIWTHDHADQVHGIDDLRPYALRQGADRGLGGQRGPSTSCAGASATVSRPRAAASMRRSMRHRLIEGPFKAAGVPVMPFVQDHGTVPSLGFRFGSVGYANDVVMLPEEAFEVLAGVEVLIVDAMRYRPHRDTCPSRPRARMDRADRPQARVPDQSPRRHGLC